MIHGRAIDLIRSDDHERITIVQFTRRFDEELDTVDPHNRREDVGIRILDQESVRSIAVAIDLKLVTIDVVFDRSDQVGAQQFHA